MTRHNDKMAEPQNRKSMKFKTFRGGLGERKVGKKTLSDDLGSGKKLLKGRFYKFGGKVGG